MRQTFVFRPAMAHPGDLSALARVDDTDIDAWLQVGGLVSIIAAVA